METNATTNVLTERSTHLALIIGPTLAIFIILMAAILIFVMVKKRISRPENAIKSEKRVTFQRISSENQTIEVGEELLPTSSSSDRRNTDRFKIIEALMESLPEKDLPSIPKNCVHKRNILGEGEFGDVYEGLAYNLPNSEKALRVAIKSLKKDRTDFQQANFLREAILMNNLNHPNIVKLLGVCFEGDTYWIVLELMEMNLLEYLISVRPTKIIPSQISLRDLLNIAIDVVRGCVFLEKIRYIHRDLAARNCLLSCRNPNLFVVKIADFGFASKIHEKDEYKLNPNDYFPIQWTAPESAKYQLFTHKSDIWSFGVLLWELLSLGEKPYSDVELRSVIPYVLAGNRLTRPHCCPDDMFEVMSSCWNEDPNSRPTFVQLKELFDQFKLLQEYKNDAPFPTYILSKGIQNGRSCDSNDTTDGIANRNYAELDFASTSNVSLNYSPIKFDEEGGPRETSRQMSNVGTVPLSPTNNMVLKIVAKMFLKNRDESLESEIQLLKSLRHPNIVNILDVLEDSQHLYLVMQRVNGGKLFNRIIEKGFYSERTAAELVKQMFHGVNYLHENYIIHGNLKPENILFYSSDNDSRIVITGFGFSTKSAEELIKENSEALDFFAPEILNRHQIIEESNLWALGVITYIIISGCYPFSAENGSGAVQKLTNGVYDFNSPQWGKTSKAAKDFISDLLQVDPKIRSSCAAALNHAWLVSTTLSTNNDLMVQEQLKKLYVKEKWKKVANTIAAIRKMSDFRGSEAGPRYVNVEESECTAQSQLAAKEKWKKTYNTTSAIRQMQKLRAPRSQIPVLHLNQDYDESVDTSSSFVYPHQIDPEADEEIEPEDKDYFMEHF